MPTEPITIGVVNCKKALNQEMLTGCYFYEIEKDTYSFFSKADVVLAHGLKNGQDWQFTLGPFTWFVRNFSIDPKQTFGDWSADVPRIRIIKAPSTHDAEDEGSFQGAAGGGGGADEKTATAGAR